jgi:DNA-binding transcriptional LysR family regulator
MRATKVATSLREDGSIENLVELVIAGELDVTFVLLPVDTDEVHTREIMRDPWTIVVRDDHPLARLQRPLTGADLSNVPIITYEDCRSQRFIEGALRAAGANVRIATRLADYRSVLTMVDAGLGVGLVPRLAAEPDLGALRMLRLDGMPPRLVGIAWSAERALVPAVERFVDLAAAAGRRVTLVA